MTPDPAALPDKDFVDAHVRRALGLAALRKIRRIVEARQEEDRQKRRLVASILVFFLAVIGLLYLLGFSRVASLVQQALNG